MSKTSRSPEREFPKSLLVERELVGVILSGHHDAVTVFRKLHAECFTSSIFRIVFLAAKKLHAERKPYDILAVSDQMSEHDLSEVGGLQGLGEIRAEALNNYDVDYACEIIVRRERQRDLIRLLEVAQESAWADRANPDDLVRSLSGQLAMLQTRFAPDAWRDMFDSFAEFEETVPLRFAIRGFLQCDAATIIGGLSGHGKTWMLLSIARALLMGKGHRLWDLFEVEEDTARILYLIPESARSPFKHRLKLFGIYPFLAPDNERLLVRTLSKGRTPSLSDPHILFAAKDSHVLLDTAVRFGEGDENDVDANRRLAEDIFALLSAGARSVIAAHHSPKSFTKEVVMTLENVLRGSGDIGAVFATGWGVKQLDADRNIVHVQNIKARDIEPCGPFQLIGRPWINDTGDFKMYKKPGECGSLQDEQQPERDKGGAPLLTREARAANIQLLREWIQQDPKQTSEQLAKRFSEVGIKLSDVTVRKYRRVIMDGPKKNSSDE
jgi:AAA domain/DnaB-like helicase N terminal domain